MKRFKPYHIAIVLVLLLAVGLRAYRVSDKESFFVDENLSIVLSNYATYGWSWPAVSVDDTVKSYEGRELKERIFSDDSSLSNIAMDIWSLRKGTRDLPHTNLYYSLLRASFWQADTASFKEVLWRGFAMNVFLFLIGFSFLFLLARLLFRGNMWLILLILLIYGLNPTSVSNTLFLREYQLQEVAFIFQVYLVLLLGKRIVEGEKLFANKLELALLTIGTAFSLLAGYLGVFYIGLLWLGLGFAALFCGGEEKFGIIAKLLGVFIVAVLFLFVVLNPAYLDGFISDRGEQAAGNLSLSFFANQSTLSMGELVSLLGASLVIFFGLCLILGGVFLVVLRNKISPFYFLLFYIILAGLAWMAFAFILAPEKSVRYIAAVIPVIYLVFPAMVLVVVTQLKAKTAFVQTVLCCVIAAFYLILTIREENIYWEVEDSGYIYKSDVETPLIVCGVFSPWMQTALAPYYTDGRQIEFVFSMDDFEKALGKYSEAYVFLGKEEILKASIPATHQISSDSVFETSLVRMGRRYKVERK